MTGARRPAASLRRSVSRPRCHSVRARRCRSWRRTRSIPRPARTRWRSPTRRRAGRAGRPGAFPPRAPRSATRAIRNPGARSAVTSPARAARARNTSTATADLRELRLTASRNRGGQSGVFPLPGKESRLRLVRSQCDSAVYRGDAMKRFIVKCVEIISYLGFFAFIIGGASGGYQRVADLGGIKPVWGALLGAILGFVLGVIVFGVLFLLLDIDDNTRRTRELLEQERRP